MRDPLAGIAVAPGQGGVALGLPRGQGLAQFGASLFRIHGHARASAARQNGTVMVCLAVPGRRDDVGPVHSTNQTAARHLVPRSFWFIDRSSPGRSSRAPRSNADRRARYALSDSAPRSRVPSESRIAPGFLGPLGARFLGLWSSLRLPDIAVVRTNRGIGHGTAMGGPAPLVAECAMNRDVGTPPWPKRGCMTGKIGGGRGESKAECGGWRSCNPGERRFQFTKCYRIFG